MQEIMETVIRIAFLQLLEPACSIMLSLVNLVRLLSLGGVAYTTAELTPSPPAPEPISIRRLSLPPVAPSSDQGACSLAINPRGTGCLAKTASLQSGHFLPDDAHVLAIASFTGAPAAPDPASIYDGLQLMILKAGDDDVFPNGDSWKCLTCGLTAENDPARNASLDYPQSFRDGTRALAGANVVDCGGADLASEACTSDKTSIHPLRWEVTNPDGVPTGYGGEMREIRLHPDNVHLGWSAFVVGDDGSFGELSYIGRLAFDPAPKSGLPLVARYDIVNVTVLYSEDTYAPFVVDPGDPSKIVSRAANLHPVVGELRGFGGTGREVTYLGPPVESCNIDVFAADLSAAAPADQVRARRLTAHPEYVDPVDVSPDDAWHVVLDTRGTDRQMWVSGMRGIPPLTDLLTASAVSSTRNNGARRFFVPWLIDRYGDRGGYFGQQINAVPGEGGGVPGSGDIDDPEWNGRADPRWSWDGTRIAYTQAQTVAPACGADNGNPGLPCYPSREPGGATERVMLAHLTSRSPLPMPPPLVPDPVPGDVVAWGTPYVPGMPAPGGGEVPAPAQGNYTLEGKMGGRADVEFLYDGDGAETLKTVKVVYKDGFSDDGEHVLEGWEKVTRMLDPETPTRQSLGWWSDLTRTAKCRDSSSIATKKTSPGGFWLEIDVLTNIFQANGTLTTTVDGVVYRQPANGT